MSNVFSVLGDEHESLHFGHDAASGLRTVVAIHSTRLGPAIGGCRFMAYDSDAAAVADALRLSRSMTLKCAIAGIPFGGGKSVVIGNRAEKTEALLEAFGTFVDGLGGHYITSFDVGTTLDDVRVMARTTRHVGGIGIDAGNASRSTALGVLACMEAAYRYRSGWRGLGGTTIAIQGLGNVGGRLAGLLYSAGARLIVADADEVRAQEVSRRYGATIVSPDDIVSQPCDIFAPCALGGVLTDLAIASLRTEIVVGAANNQLADEHAEAALISRGIIYAPDFLANAGGIIDLHYQINQADRGELDDHLKALGEALTDILNVASQNNLSTQSVAEHVARAQVESGCVPGNRPASIH